MFFNCGVKNGEPANDFLHVSIEMLIERSHFVDVFHELSMFVSCFISFYHLFAGRIAIFRL